MAGAFLKITDLYKSFGGVAATDHVNLELVEGEIHAVIGPNGAGKTTLIAQLSGELRPDRGRIEFLGRDITQTPAHRRCHLGLARSFQISSIILEMTVLENVALAVQALAGHSYRFWRRARADRALTGPAMAALAKVDLDGRADVPSKNLSHGEHRQLDIAMALASEPKLLLLDEPTAGMAADETRRLIETLAGLKGEKTMLLVEHDMDAVFALADRITVLVYGRVIASGGPDRIRADESVRRAYLGDPVA